MVSNIYDDDASISLYVSPHIHITTRLSAAVLRARLNEFNIDPRIHFWSASVLRRHMHA